MRLLKFGSRADKKDYELISDLDSILSEPISFKLHGRVRVIRPVSTEEFLHFSNALAKLYDLQEKSGVTPEELISRYFDLAKSIIEDITRKDIEDMAQVQIAGLFALLMDVVTGKAHADNEKKKKELLVRELRNKHS